MKGNYFKGGVATLVSISYFQITERMNNPMIELIDQMLMICLE